jgi:hypothetical protein
VQRGGSKQSHVVVSLLTDDRNVSRQKRIYSFSVVLRDQSFMTFILSLKAERPVFYDGPSHLLITDFLHFLFSFLLLRVILNMASHWLEVHSVQCAMLCPTVHLDQWVRGDQFFR